MFTVPEKLKKVSTAFIIVSLLIPYAFLARPQETRAAASGSVIVVGADLPRDPKEGIAGTGIGLDALAWVAAKLAIQAMTASIVSWINTGFEGDPTFITNPKDFFVDVANETTGAFIYELGLTELCSPFEPLILIDISTRSTFQQRAECTLDDVIDNIDAFYDDFRQGGWEAWLHISQNRQNNPYGALQIAREELAARQAQSAEFAEQETAQGQGFITLKTCVERAPVPGPSGTGPGVSPGAIAEQGPCLRYENQTPGQVISDQLDVALGSPFRQAEAADEIQESIASIADALINQFILEGLRTLSGGSGGVPDREVAPWYEGAINGDRDEFVDAVEEAMAREQAKIDANNQLGTYLSLIDATRACYDEQIATVNSHEFFPAEGYTAPTPQEINDRKDALTEKEQAAIEAAGGVSVAEAQQNLNFYQGLLNDLSAAENDADGLTPAELTDLWVRFNEYEKEYYDDPDSAESDQNLREVQDAMTDLQNENARCEAELEQLKGHIRPEPVEPVECVEGCETEVFVDVTVESP